MAKDFDVFAQQWNNGARAEHVAAFAGSDRDRETSALLPTSARMAVKAAGRILFIDPAEVFAIEASANYVVLRRKHGKYVVRQTISQIAEKLQSLGFVRIHRSVVVNSLLAKEVHSLPSGEYLLRMEGGSQYKVARTFKNNLRLLAPLWLGACARFDI